MTISKFQNYTIEAYKNDLDALGLKKTWQDILNYRKSHSDESVVDILKTCNFGELYEIGLAHVNKISKKEMGKYFTPEDVATLMSEYFDELQGYNICDVCCGVGNLILSYLAYIGKDRARKLILSDSLYLYDIDEIAMNICKHSIAFIYGNDCLSHIRCVKGDFISKKITLPSDCKVIANPPYFKINEFGKDWILTDVIKDSKEYYSAFMEKIITNSKASVIITPFSFIGSDKFYSLRQILNDYNGFIFSFDNVPANIFNGRKHGIFNSNCSNAVRAAITVVENKPAIQGFRVSPLIRFQTAERSKLLNKNVLDSMLPNTYLIATENHPKYPKCFKSLQHIYDTWISMSDSTFEDLLSDTETKYRLDVPTTCRYFLSATERKLQRDGKNTFYFKDEVSYYYAYCLLNSSFAYWYWRLFDGGITYPIGLLKTIPIRIQSLSSDEIKTLKTIVNDTKDKESDFLVYKKNASEMQENVKFPDEYRNRFNEFIFATLQIHGQNDAFAPVHSNCVFMR